MSIIQKIKAARRRLFPAKRGNVFASKFLSSKKVIVIRVDGEHVEFRDVGSIHKIRLHRDMFYSIYRKTSS